MYCVVSRKKRQGGMYATAKKSLRVADYSQLKLRKSHTEYKEQLEQ